MIIASIIFIYIMLLLILPPLAMIIGGIAFIIITQIKSTKLSERILTIICGLGIIFVGVIFALAALFFIGLFYAIVNF